MVSKPEQNRIKMLGGLAFLSKLQFPPKFKSTRLKWYFSATIDSHGSIWANEEMQTSERKAEYEDMTRGDRGEAEGLSPLSYPSILLFSCEAAFPSWPRFPHGFL